MKIQKKIFWVGERTLEQLGIEQLLSKPPYSLKRVVQAIPDQIGIAPYLKHYAETLENARQIWAYLFGKEEVNKKVRPTFNSNGTSSDSYEPPKIDYDA